MTTEERSDDGACACSDGRDEAGGMAWHATCLHLPGIPHLGWMATE
jgi:hypothetical protein